VTQLPTAFASKVVVIGGSAGAYRTLETILRDLPSDLPAAVLVVVHVQPSGANWLSQRLAQFTRWPVSAPTNEILQAGQVYTAKPDHHLLIKEDRVSASHGPRENMWRPAIDVLFRSAAVWHSTRVIGVLLSGELDDGTSGIQALKACGATTIVQEPATAEYPTMPRVALANADVDYRAEAAEIGSLIARLVQEPAREPAQIPTALRQEVEMADEGTTLLTSDIMPQAPTALSCPECGGPLWERDETSQSFRCLVGHAYHIGTLRSAVDDALDRTVWAAIRLFEQRAHIAQMMADDARGRNLSKRADVHTSRAKEAKLHVARLRELLGLWQPIRDEAESS
jgi:two-component system, chemotaxis family, protein-glutamate methylesterase/glutaminase